MPHPLDEYPIHQSPLSMEFVASSDRNFYDRCYFNAHDRTGDIFFISGLGVYPNLGVIDAYATIGMGDKHVSIHASDALGTDRLHQAVGPYRIEVIEPLSIIRLVCDGDEYGVGFDLLWEGSFPPVQEPQHVVRTGSKVLLDGCRFAQVGTWSGTLRVEGVETVVTPDRWVGTCDRSWGIRPVGEAEPPGRWTAEGMGGFWWLYVPLRFDDFAVILIVQEEADGTRVMCDARQVWPASSGRPPTQLGWPEVSIRYRPGSRHPLGAHIALRDLELDIETLGFVSLSHGAGYGGQEWRHGQWMGPGWVEGTVHDLTDPAIAPMIPFGVIDHVGRATATGGAVPRGRAEGWGLFEHASFGRHDPSGMVDFSSVAS